MRADCATTRSCLHRLIGALPPGATANRLAARPGSRFQFEAVLYFPLSCESRESFALLRFEDRSSEDASVLASPRSLLQRHPSRPHDKYFLHCPASTPSVYCSKTRKLILKAYRYSVQQR